MGVLGDALTHLFHGKQANKRVRESKQRVRERICVKLTVNSFIHNGVGDVSQTPSFVVQADLVTVEVT